MKGKTDLFLALTLAATLSAAPSCSKDQGNATFVTDTRSGARLVPVDEALETLDGFIGAAATKSGPSRRIADIQTYYSDPLTKGGDALPDSYIVNYEDGEGFAVLGANSAMLPVVAYTDRGSLSVDDLRSYRDAAGSGAPSLMVDDEGCPMTTLTAPAAVIAAIVTTLSRYAEGYTKSGEATEADAVSPLLSTQWSQGTWGQPGPYNRYCLYAGNYAFAGCGVIATAQVMVNNKYADPVFDYARMITTGRLEDCVNINSDRVDYTGQFIGSVFARLVNFANDKYGTATSIAGIKRYLSQMDGYRNVRYSLQNSFTDKVVQTAQGMLREGKPVIVCASHTILDGHTWVLDGYRYFNGDLYFHCNWGYGGAFDGYFSADWFCLTADNAKYDSPADAAYAAEVCRANGQDISSDYNWWVGMVTYDK